jgi:hypothetical protein
MHPTLNEKNVLVLGLLWNSGFRGTAIHTRLSGYKKGIGDLFPDMAYISARRFHLKNGRQGGSNSTVTGERCAEENKESSRFLHR